MRRYSYFVVFLATAIYYSVGSWEDAANEKRLRRKKRYLTFPEGSIFVVTLSNTKGLMWDVPTYDGPPWNSIIEFDLVFNLPNMTKPLSTHKTASRRHEHLYEPRSQHTWERRQFYRQMENVLDAQGEDGRMCIYRALCEAKYLLKPGRSFIEDIMHAIFRYPGENGEPEADPEGYETAEDQETCMTWSRECPYSLLNLLVS